MYKMVNILNAFQSCSKQESCEKCPANEKITGEDFSFCELLRCRNQMIEEKVEEILQNI